MRRLLPVLPLAFAVAIPALAGPISDRIYPAPREPLSLAGLPESAALVRVATADGLTLSGVEVPGRTDRPVVLVFHGNASDADGAVDWLRPLASRGYGIVSAEYRGYSGNPGHPSEAGLAADADAFFDRARAIARGRPIIVLGHSLGGGVGFGLVKRQPVAALVTVGGFTRMRAMAPRIARAFIGDRYDNLAAVPTLAVPLYLVHATDDAVVPAAMGNQLYRAAVAAKRQGGAIVLARGGHHPDGETIAGIVDAVAAQIARPDAALAPGAGATFYPFA